MADSWYKATTSRGGGFPSSDLKTVTTTLRLDKLRVGSYRRLGGFDPIAAPFIMAGFNDAPLIRIIAVPSVCMLIAFLGYGSQLTFHLSSLEPGELTPRETYTFNALLAILWFTYYRAVTTDPGRYVFPSVVEAEGRWCGKCAAPKPLRAHHCRTCARCVPRMDHHCPWTANCVSMTTFPHFLRFLFFANVALGYLSKLLYLRVHALWESRHLPSYLGPTLPALTALAVLGLVNFVTSVALGIMLFTTVKGWMFNTTMIEGWEIERHEAVAEKAGRDWWDVTMPSGDPYQFEQLEFPYDVGVFANMAQAMGTSNPLLWLFPFAGNPKIGEDGKGAGWTWPENGFNRIAGLWPPPDPEKLRRANKPWPAAQRNFEEELREAGLSPEERKEAFRKRQAADLRRQRILVNELEEIDDDDDEYDDGTYPDEDQQKKPSRWLNTDGDALRDFGVDEDAEEDDPGAGAVDAAQDEDDVPLAEILRRRKVLRKDGED